MLCCRALLTFSLLWLLGKSSDKIKGISSQYNNDQHKIEQYFGLWIQIFFGGKHFERIVCRMKQNTRDQRFPAEEDQYKYESDQNRKYDLNCGRNRIPSASVEQIHDMSETERQRRYNNGRLQIVLFNGPEQEPAENDFFQKADTAHADKVQQPVRKAILRLYPAPKSG